MSDRPTEIIRLLFGLPPSEINRDLATASDNRDALEQSMSDYLRSAHLAKAPEREALYYHQQILHAHALHQLTEMPEDVRFFFVVQPVAYIADIAGDAASGQGKIAELDRLMQEMEKRDGLTEDQYWPLGEGPADYQAVRDQSEAHFDHIHDVVTVQILRRYGFHDYADLYTRDRMLFDVRLEVGRRLIVPDLEHLEDSIYSPEDSLRKRYGEKAIRLFHQRYQAQKDE